MTARASDSSGRMGQLNLHALCRMHSERPAAVFQLYDCDLGGPPPGSRGRGLLCRRFDLRAIAALLFPGGSCITFGC